ncbi:MAG: hypothetical protein M1829_002643 [Trizodia sp. TS-e1964]|nr:MAG: hypothetical protein M1829_002643 [Trizodia sp. TS-e1964]
MEMDADAVISIKGLLSTAAIPRPILAEHTDRMNNGITSLIILLGVLGAIRLHNNILQARGINGKELTKTPIHIRRQAYSIKLNISPPTGIRIPRIEDEEALISFVVVQTVTGEIKIASNSLEFMKGAVLVF